MGQGEQDIVEQGKDAADQGKDAVGQGGKDRYLFHNNHFKPTNYAPTQPDPTKQTQPNICVSFQLKHHCSFLNPQILTCCKMTVSCI